MYSKGYYVIMDYIFYLFLAQLDIHFLFVDPDLTAIHGVLELVFQLVQFSSCHVALCF